MAAPTRRRLWAGPVLRMTTVRKKFKGAFAELHSNSLGVYHSATPDRTAVPETVIVLDQASTAKAAHADPPDDQPKNLAVEVAGRTAKGSNDSVTISFSARSAYDRFLSAFAERNGRSNQTSANPAAPPANQTVVLTPPDHPPPPPDHPPPPTAAKPVLDSLSSSSSAAGGRPGIRGVDDDVMAMSPLPVDDVDFLGDTAGWGDPLADDGVSNLPREAETDPPAESSAANRPKAKTGADSSPANLRAPHLSLSLSSSVGVVAGGMEEGEAASSSEEANTSLSNAAAVSDRPPLIRGPLADGPLAEETEHGGVVYRNAADISVSSLGSDDGDEFDHPALSMFPPADGNVHALSETSVDPSTAPMSTSASSSSSSSGRLAHDDALEGLRTSDLLAGDDAVPSRGPSSFHLVAPAPVATTLDDGGDELRASSRMLLVSARMDDLKSRLDTQLNALVSEPFLPSAHRTNPSTPTRREVADAFARTSPVYGRAYGGQAPSPYTSPGGRVGTHADYRQRDAYRDRRAATETNNVPQAPAETWTEPVIETTTSAPPVRDDPDPSLYTWADPAANASPADKGEQSSGAVAGSDEVSLLRRQLAEKTRLLALQRQAFEAQFTTAQQVQQSLQRDLAAKNQALAAAHSEIARLRAAMRGEAGSVPALPTGPRPPSPYRATAATGADVTAAEEEIEELAAALDASFERERSLEDHVIVQAVEYESLRGLLAEAVGELAQTDTEMDQVFERVSEVVHDWQVHDPAPLPPSRFRSSYRSHRGHSPVTNWSGGRATLPPSPTPPQRQSPLPSWRPESSSRTAAILAARKGVPGGPLQVNPSIGTPAYEPLRLSRRPGSNRAPQQSTMVAAASGGLHGSATHQGTVRRLAAPSPAYVPAVVRHRHETEALAAELSMRAQTSLNDEIAAARLRQAARDRVRSGALAAATGGIGGSNAYY